jgi:hypothetical protein
MAFAYIISPFMPVCLSFSTMMKKGVQPLRSPEADQPFFVKATVHDSGVVVVVCFMLIHFCEGRFNNQPSIHMVATQKWSQ